MEPPRPRPRPSQVDPAEWESEQPSRGRAPEPSRADIVLERVEKLLDTIPPMQKLTLETQAKAVAKLEARVEVLEQTAAARVKAALDKAEASQAHWLRYVVGAIVSAFVGAVFVLLGFLLKK